MESTKTFGSIKRLWDLFRFYFAAACKPIGMITFTTTIGIEKWHKRLGKVRCRRDVIIAPKACCVTRSDATNQTPRSVNMHASTVGVEVHAVVGYRAARWDVNARLQRHVPGYCARHRNGARQHTFNTRQGCHHSLAIAKSSTRRTSAAVGMPHSLH